MREGAQPLGWLRDTCQPQRQLEVGQPWAAPREGAVSCGKDAEERGGPAYGEQDGGPLSPAVASWVAHGQ